MGSPTTNYGWTKPTVGDDDDAWGGQLNTDLDSIDSVVKGVSNAIPAASTTTPSMDGAAAVGTGATWARADHVHPTDTSRAPTASPTFTGTMTGVNATLSGLLTPSGGIKGVTDGSSAAAGQVGEVISSNVTTGVPLTNAVAANVASISLTAGDWEVTGEVWHAIGTGAATAAYAGISATSASLPGASSINQARTSYLCAITASATTIISLRPCQANLTATTTYFLVGMLLFPSGTCTATGNITARRMR